MMGHKICFYGEIWLIIPKLSLLLLIWSTATILLYIYECLHLSSLEAPESSVELSVHYLEIL